MIVTESIAKCCPFSHFHGQTLTVVFLVSDGPRKGRLQEHRVGKKKRDDNGREGNGFCWGTTPKSHTEGNQQSLKDHRVRQVVLASPAVSHSCDINKLPCRSLISFLSFIYLFVYFFLAPFTPPPPPPPLLQNKIASFYISEIARNTCRFINERGFYFIFYLFIYLFFLFSKVLRNWTMDVEIARAKLWLSPVLGLLRLRKHCVCLCDCDSTCNQYATCCNEDFSDFIEDITNGDWW